MAPQSPQTQDGENSPPGANQLKGSPNSNGLTPGGVGSPSKNRSRNTPETPKSKASALPSKSKKKKNTNSPATDARQLAGTAASDAVDVATGHGSGRVSSERQAACGPREGFGVGLRELRDSGGGGEGAGKSKVVIAVSRRVSVLRVSTAGGRRWVNFEGEGCGVGVKSGWA